MPAAPSQSVQIATKLLFSTGKSSSTSAGGSRIADLGPMPDFKYFVNKSTVLGVYREALQLCQKGFSDP